MEDFDATLARVLAHLDLPPDPNCARFYESDNRVRTVSYAQVRQPVNARGLGRWKTYQTELAPLIAELEQSNDFAGWDKAPGRAPSEAHPKTLIRKLSRKISRPKAKIKKAAR